MTCPLHDRDAEVCAAGGAPLRYAPEIPTMTISA